MASVPRFHLDGQLCSTARARSALACIARGQHAALKSLDLFNNKIGDVGAAAIANAIAVNASLKLKVLWVPSAIKSNPQLVAACRAKGVELKSVYL